MGGAPPPPLGAAPQGAKNPEKFGPKRAGFGRVEATEDHAQEGGGRGSRPLPDPALWGGRRAQPVRRPAAVPAGPIRRAIKRLGPDQSRRSEASDAASERSRPGIYRNKRVGATRPRHGHDGDHPIGSVFMDRSFKRSVRPPLQCRRHTMLRMAPRAGRCEVTRPVARANRNAVTGASDDWVPIWGKPRCIDPSGADTDALTHLGQALMHWTAGPPDRAQLGPLRGPPPGAPEGPILGVPEGSPDRAPDGPVTGGYGDRNPSCWSEGHRALPFGTQPYGESRRSGRVWLSQTASLAWSPPCSG